MESRLHQLRLEGEEVTDDTVKIQIINDLEEKQKASKGQQVTDEDVKIQVLTDLQEKQEGESKSVLTDLHDKVKKNFTDPVFALIFFTYLLKSQI